LSVKIKVLPENLANKIAAGEVVERPASVVKELVENALDAGARRIVVEVQSGGTKLISVSDDGHGMGQDDAILSLERHATSKIKDADGLAAISTLGFRGEALPSIASVSRLRLTTSVGDGSAGTLLVVEGGRLVNVREVGAPRGTAIEVRDLFFNTPARLKFLKSVETESGHIAAFVEKAALAHPGVHFRLTNNGRDGLDCPPVKDVKDRVAQVYGREFADRLIAMRYESGHYRVSGFISAPGVSFRDRSYQELFINNRPVKSPAVTRAVYDACQSLLMKDRHPASIIYLDMDPRDLDVNVHPAKREVRFADNGAVHRAVFEAVKAAYTGVEAGAAPAETFDGTPYKDRVMEAAEAYVSGASGRPDYFPRADIAHRQEAMSFPRGRMEIKDMPGDGGPVVQQYGNAPVQVADSYIVVPSGEGFMVIDQHAAHERVQYEKVKARHGKQGALSQGLLVPVQLELTAKEAALMEGLLPELNDIGLEVEHFGGGSFMVKSKPLFLDKVDVKELVMGILSDMDESDIKGSVEGMREKVYQLMACKSAVKAGQRLHPEAISRLIKQLFECEMPYTCAHGRPTVVRFGLGELEKMFKRK